MSATSAELPHLSTRILIALEPLPRGLTEAELRIRLQVDEEPNSAEIFDLAISRLLRAGCIAHSTHINDPAAPAPFVLTDHGIGELAQRRLDPSSGAANYSPS